MSIGHPWISEAKEKIDVLYQAKKLPNVARNCRAFVTGKLGEKPTCAHLLRHKTYKTYSVELVSVHFEVELH